MKKTMLVFSLTVGAFVCAQSNRETKVISFKNDQEKQEWIRNHPEEYKKMGGTVSSTTPEFKSQAEKDAWVNSRKAVPEFKSQQEKDAWFENQKLKTVKANENQNRETYIANEAEKDAYLLEKSKKVSVTQEEFNALPADKQAAMKADKNFIIINNK
jgi:hypothetical protein